MAEGRKRWGGIVCEENVGRGTGGEQRRLALRGGDVAWDWNNLGAACGLQLGGRCRQRLAVAAVDDDVAARLRQRERAGAAEPAARGADDGFAAGDAEIHDDAPMMSFTL